MPRIKLTEQENYEFSHKINVRITDLNPASHVGAVELTGLIHETRVQVLRDIHAHEGNLGDGETGIIMGDMAINFRSEAFLFDELIMQTHIGEIGAKNFRFFHRIMKGDNIVALAETGFVAFNFIKREIAGIPDCFLKALDDFKKSR